MTDNNENLKLIRMNEVEAEEIRWLWYPYILNSREFITMNAIKC